MYQMVNLELTDKSGQDRRRNSFIILNSGHTGTWYQLQILHVKRNSKDHGGGGSIAIVPERVETWQVQIPILPYSFRVNFHKLYKL